MRKILYGNLMGFCLAGVAYLVGYKNGSRYSIREFRDDRTGFVGRIHE